MHTCQAIGECIGAVVLMVGGAYVVWFYPRRVHDQVQSGKLSNEEALGRLRKFSPLLGYLGILYGLLSCCRHLF